MERLNAYLAQAGVASRRAVDAMIERGDVVVNGKTAVLGQKIEGREDIRVNGKCIERDIHRDPVYIILNKPVGVVTTSDDEQGRETVLDVVNVEDRIYPVGRLDMMSTGVLLLTNDGEFAYALTHPKHAIEKIYDVVLDTPLAERDRRELERGIRIDGGMTAPCTIEISIKDRRVVQMTLREGKNRQIRKMFSQAGYDVLALDRVQSAGITHEGLKKGEWRHLTREEIERIKSMIG